MKTGVKKRGKRACKKTGEIGREGREGKRGAGVRRKGTN